MCGFMDSIFEVVLWSWWILSDAATQVMASHHDGVTRLLKPWWPKMIEPKAMSPSQWLAIEDGPDMAGWYIYYDENGLATLEEY